MKMLLILLVVFVLALIAAYFILTQQTKPSVGQSPSVQPNIVSKASTSVTSGPGSKTYQVNVGQGIGVRTVG
jgi:flagellar basal body-associated protein FliL